MAEIFGWGIALTIGAAMFVAVILVIGAGESTITAHLTELSVCRKNAVSPDEWHKC